MTNEEKAREVAVKHLPFCGVPIKECVDAALEMAEWKDEQFNEERNVLLNLLKLLIAAGGDTKIIEQLIDTLDSQTIIENLAELLK